MSVRAAIPTLPARYEHPSMRSADAPVTGGALGTRLPMWLQLTLLYAVSRVVTTVIMLLFARAQESTWQTPSPQPDYVTFANLWDAKWYLSIGYNGYPTELPVDAATGKVTENAWAFMPVYPLLVRAVSTLTTLPFQHAAVLVSLVAGLGVAFALHRLLQPMVGERTSLFAVALVMFGPVSPMFQVGYAEALHFWMLCELLIYLRDRRWLAMMPLVALASLTRPTGLAWAFALLLVILYRYYNSLVRRVERFDVREQREAWGVAVFSGVMGLAWLALCGVVTGRPFGYLETEFAWRDWYVEGATTPPFTAWFYAAKFWSGQPIGAFAVTAMVVTVVGVVVWFASPVMRRFGPELTAWGVAYFSYIFAVFFPQSSTFRMLFPMFPAAAAPLALPKSPLYRVLVLLGGVVLQVVWIRYMWFVSGHDWTAP